ncbi:MAG TPA: DegT/DnrJ/EryC1/StrS family aminotransferase [Candidatus Acidoferrales bacterium]|nr:DegT/DnrJ/EryC1/StrS family aminotransferase [Candidatus Acidoferrales bacterium]
MHPESSHRILPSDQDASGRSLGEREVVCLSEAIATGTLTSTKGRFVRALERSFAEQIGVKHVYACSSGSAAVHCAIAALDLEPGDEVITTPITDMGALAPILFQGAIPVFADVDPKTLNLTAQTITAVLSERTKAIVVTHLFGTPCEMREIEELASRHGLPIIEDCAQAFLAKHDDRYVGGIGRIGAFSLQQGKHITTGEGGLVTTNDDELARRVFLFINKAWGYGDASPDHYFLALNYRMTELQGAVGLAQLGKLERAVERRIQLANILTRWLEDVDGISVPIQPRQTRGVFWKYAIRLDPNVFPGGPPSLAAKLKDQSILTAPRYIQKPAFECAVIRDQRTFGKSRWPFTLARPDAVRYDRERYPGVYEGLDRILVIPWNDKLTIGDVEYIARSIISAVRSLKEAA